MTWTDTRVEILKQSWQDGLSASLVAQKLETTRNAVIGKARRLGLAFRITSSRRRPVKPRPAKARTKPAPPPFRFGGRKKPDRAGTRTPKRPAAIPDLGPAPDIPVTVATLTPTTCKWPLGDPKRPGFHFCGRTKPVTGPYCAHHAAIAFCSSR